MEIQQQILSLLKKTILAVIATVEGNKTESAVLEFGQTDNLELIFDTFVTSRKYKNIQRNNNVSFVIGWDNNITVQYQGIAEELSGKEKERYQKIYWQKNPQAKRWAKKEGITYFKVTPKWIRYSDLNKNPWDIRELNF